MGAGLALECKNRFVGIDQMHRYLTQSGKHAIGEPHILSEIEDWRSGVILFPTKRHFSDPSQIEWIERGLGRLQSKLHRGYGGLTIGMPMLGCGHGGLRTQDVIPLLEAFARTVEQIVYIYP
jgi:hypothetical protein